MAISTVIFDFDGTLHDSMVIYRRALRRGYAWLVERGKAPARELSDELIECNIGLTAQEAWERMCPDVPWSVSSEAAVLVGQTMDELIAAGEARLYPGVQEMLSTVATDHRLVFLSNCRNAYRDAVREAFGFDRWFTNYYTAEQFNGAPKETIFETIREEVEGPFVAVGDRYKDLALARAHALPSIGCLYGYGSKEELVGATHLAKTPAEIPSLLARIDLGR